jgi:hypothetical protein
MRKIALLIAAALTVSAPLVAMSTTDTYAAAKKASKGGKEAKADPNTAFIRAVGDLAKSLENPWPAKGAKGSKSKGKKG